MEGEQPFAAAPDREGGAASSDKTLVIGIGAEVRGFSTLNNLQNKYVEDLLQGNLFLQDESGRWFPAIAAETPTFENGAWKLNEEGTSEVTYKIRRGVKWHDGVEFTVHDIVFFWKVALDREIPWESRSQPGRITRMEPTDDYTVKMTFDRWEPEADTADLRWFWPIPRHLLEDVYHTDKQRFINHPFWTTDFVGLGPYKLVRFVPGSHLELTANDGYILGKPKIRNIVVKFYPDSNSLVADLMAGNVHMTLHGTPREGGLSMANGILLGTRWSQAGEGKVIFNPYRIALIAFQLNPEFQRPAALGDGRVRQALLHAIDRQALIDKLFGGFTDIAHGWLPPSDPDYSIIAQAIIRHEYDPARAQQLLAAAGWQKGSDGTLLGPGGQRFAMEYRAISRDQQDTATIVADYWKRLGLSVQLMFVPEARIVDHEWMAKFSGVRAHEMVSAPVGGGTHRYSCTRVPAVENNWLYHTTNPGGYCSEEMQRYWKAVEEAFPFSARMEPFKEMMRIALKDLPYLPIYFESEPVAVRANVKGVERVPPKNRGRIGMHAYIWDIQ